MGLGHGRSNLHPGKRQDLEAVGVNRPSETECEAICLGCTVVFGTVSLEIWLEPDGEA